MCGIAGILSFKEAAIQGGSAIHKMAHAMQHRGPDDEGYLMIGNNASEIQIAFGTDTFYTKEIPETYRPTLPIQTLLDKTATLFLAHRRLAIVDLSAAGHQPMATEDRRYWIVYNGEVYNYPEITKQLIAEGEKIVSHSDTEIVLKSYRRWGPAALTKFNGMFAFAIWDNEKKELFCARDRIGIKPFYYTICNDQFIFASDIKTIIASRLYQPTVSIEGLYHAMSYGIAPRPNTCFNNVFALEQAHWLLVRADGTVNKQRYWKIPLGTQNKKMKEHDAKELLDTALTKAVNRCLVSDVPVGTFMSGGVDSTTITAMAAIQTPGVRAFSLGYDDEEAKQFNEIPEAKATAALYDIDHIIRMVKAELTLQDIDDVIRLYEEPFYSLSPNYIISKLVAETDTKVILSGLGGDELFGGYRHFSWANRRPLVKAGAFFFKAIKKHSDYYQRISEFTTASTIDRYYSLMSTNMSEGFKKQLFTAESTASLNTIETLHDLYAGPEIRFTDNIEAMCHMNLMHYMGNHHVYRMDQFTMNFSLEARFPFLDHELVEAAFKIPSHYKIKQGERKYLLRRVAEKYIAPTCLSMKKKGFSLPMDHWLRTTLSNYAETKLQNLTKREIFNSSQIQKALVDFKAGKLNSRYIWQLVSTELWLSTFF